MSSLLARSRLLADATSSARDSKRDDIQKKIDKSREKIDQIKKGLPSSLNRMSVSQENQISKRKQILTEKQRIEDFKSQKLRLKET